MWDTRYRPRVFSEVLGQEGSVQVLRARLSKGEAFDTSYIFAGDHGSGKTTLARILARAMLCLNRQADGDPCNVCDHCRACLDENMVAFTELDAASQGRTADMRQLVDNLGYSIPGVPKRIYLLDEAHQMSRDAQDVLLKPIEDKRVVILFCTTEHGKIRSTIKSRCETYEIRKIRQEDILSRVKLILQKEGVAFEDEGVLTVIDHARGHVRDILNKLETIAQLGPITVDAVRERLDLGVVSLYYEILLALGGDAQEVVGRLEEACDRVGPAQVATGLAEAAMNAYRQAHKIYTDYSQVDRERAARVHEKFGRESTSVARYFLGLGTQVSRVDLVCAAVSWGAPVPVAVPPPVWVAPAVSPVAQTPLPASSPSEPPQPAAAVVPAALLPQGPSSLPTFLPLGPAASYAECNVPTCPVDAAAMGAAHAKGAGPADAGYTLKTKPNGRNAEPKRVPFGPVEFKALLVDILGPLHG